MSTSAEDLRAIALTEFATSGYASTSLHRIAELAGLSKSSVLYHFASKDALLEAVVTPAIEGLDQIHTTLATHADTKLNRRAFIADFVDFLLAHRLEVHLFINQGPSLVDVPVIDRANDLVQRLVNYFANTVMTAEHRMRFAVALGGAAYMLVTREMLEMDPATEDETRAALNKILTELLAPVPETTASATTAPATTTPATTASATTTPPTTTPAATHQE